MSSGEASNYCGEPLHYSLHAYSRRIQNDRVHRKKLVAGASGVADKLMVLLTYLSTSFPYPALTKLSTCDVAVVSSLS